VVNRLQKLDFMQLYIGKFIKSTNKHEATHRLPIRDFFTMPFAGKVGGTEKNAYFYSPPTK
jgi:hypothetical protein